MIDIQLVRENPDLVEESSKNKGVEIDVQALLALDDKRREIQQTTDDLRHKQNEMAKQVKGKPSDEHLQEAARIKGVLKDLEEQQREVQDLFETALEAVPNIPLDDVPKGKDETENILMREVGGKPSFDFDPKPHWEIGAELDLMDNERAAKISGSRFTFIKGQLALVQMALVQHAFRILTDESILSEIASEAGLSVVSRPFTPIIPPVIVKRETLKRMARLEPEDDRYHIPTDDLFLVGSAEHSTGSMHMDETLDEDVFPLRYAAYSPAFRREAGSHGKDVRGILRQHQFDKIELESFTLPEHSTLEQDFIVAIQEHLVQSLNLPYQVVMICTGDMGAPDARQIDIETWMPGQDTYRETHTSDLMTDYQSRSLQTKVKRADGTKEYVHMNDATAFAIGRILIAIIENHQQANGSISVPEALHPYLPFTEIQAEK